jgi:hypothetical protein
MPTKSYAIGVKPGSALARLSLLLWNATSIL